MRPSPDEHAVAGDCPLHAQTGPRSRIRGWRSRRLIVASVVVALVFAMVTTVGVTSAPAGADTVIDGCTIVANPTPTAYTNCPGADLSGANLSGIDLSYADLSGANLTGANLTASNLTSGNLSNASLVTCSWSASEGFFCTIANFNGATLIDANLSGASTSSCIALANVSDCDGAAMSEADFNGANLTGDDLSWADLSEANLPTLRSQAPCSASAHLSHTSTTWSAVRPILTRPF
jgi:hypothetical protein